MHISPFSNGFLPNPRITFSARKVKAGFEPTSALSEAKILAKSTVPKDHERAYDLLKAVVEHDIAFLPSHSTHFYSAMTMLANGQGNLPAQPDVARAYLQRLETRARQTSNTAEYNWLGHFYMTSFGDNQTEQDRESGGSLLRMAAGRW
jgi:hypothetical protein